MAQTDTFTRWSVIASGEGGGRIASQFFDRAENPGIDDRVLVMNTNRTDIANTIERIDRNTIDIQDIRSDHTLEFGPLDGVGNYFPGGERCATIDEDRIIVRNVISEKLRAKRGFDPSHGLEILNCHWDAMERPSRVAVLELLLRCPRLFAGLVGSHRDKCVRSLIPFLDSIQNRLDSSDRGKLTIVNASRQAGRRQFMNRHHTHGTTDGDKKHPAPGMNCSP
jgi:hypothetical protein